ncbi:MAG: sugar ABC transporter ATP-binding protein [Lachnospiraceae bacterium]|nr:sugar ABC transporter ATP-binding protein [Lachnospiraceae bacterium]
MSEKYLLEMNGIKKSFPGVIALKDANLRLRSGTVHALMGENGAGKSTLMKCLFGIYKKDSGSIRIDGSEVNFSSPKDALDHGVAMVHQELNQVMHQNVMENIWLGRYPIKNGFIDNKKMYDDTKAALDELEIDIDPNTLIKDISVSMRQMLEICRAVSYRARILVLDEPTSSLADDEVEHLFRILNKLCANGTGVIYISHKMDEIKRIADDITIMRDGQWVSTDPASALTKEEIIKRMVAREMSQQYPNKTNTPGKELLEVSHLSGRHKPACKDVSFTLRAGEILGISGLDGAGKTELLETIFGIRESKEGTIKKDGKIFEKHNPRYSIEKGLSLVTEERHKTGIFPYGTVRFNMLISNMKNYKEKFFLSDKKIDQDTDKMISSMHIRTAGHGALIKNLSGGNQQKVILGRWLLTEPMILLLDEPTRGIDVGSKYEIYELIIQLAAEGKGILMVSSEMPELIGICDRILVMSSGQLAGTLERGKDFAGVDGEQQTIMKLATKYV